MFSAGVIAMVADVFVMVVILTMLFAIDPRLALAALALVPVLGIAAAIFRYKVREAYREVRVKIARLNAHLQETISGMKVVQLFAPRTAQLRGLQPRERFSQGFLAALDPLRRAAVLDRRPGDEPDPGAHLLVRRADDGTGRHHAGHDLRVL